MPEFRYHDDLPARGEWPGGKRYGYAVERDFRPRVWSVGDQLRAEEAGIELPAMDMQTYESWWDQPERYITEVVTHGDLEPGWWLTDAASAVTFEQRTITAKRWRFITWAYQPPWVRREPR